MTMAINTITSVHNQRVKDAVKLRDHRQRAKQGRFLIDGAREILRAMSGGVQLVEAVRVRAAVHNRPRACQVLSELRRLGAPRSGTSRPRCSRNWPSASGTKACWPWARRRACDSTELEVPARRIDRRGRGPGKAGQRRRRPAQRRRGRRGGRDRRRSRAPIFYNPNCIRASLGTIFTQPVCQATTSQTLAWLRGRGCKIFAARLDATLRYTDVDYRGDAAIVLGSEAAGLSDAWQAADVTAIKLPMHGAADSLNVSATAAVLFYEACGSGQRNASKNPGECLRSSAQCCCRAAASVLTSSMVTVSGPTPPGTGVMWPATWLTAGEIDVADQAARRCGECPRRPPPRRA